MIDAIEFFVNPVSAAPEVGSAFVAGVDAILGELMAQIWGTFSSAPLPYRVE